MVPTRGVLIVNKLTLLCAINHLINVYILLMNAAISKVT